MLYTSLKKLLFCFKPEASHSLSLHALKLLDQVSLLKAFVSEKKSHPVKLFGLTFENPVGLAAGLDKNGDYIDCLAKLGFGFIEIGTVTPLPQKGNPPPRLFRLVEQEALINRMGFNNKGIDHLVKKLQEKKYHGILGINIGKNAITPIENAIEDYKICMRKVYQHASYITVNISSPNTPQLRNLQSEHYLQQLLVDLKTEHMHLVNKYHRYVPLLIKIAPDLTTEEIKWMAKKFVEYKIDGVIATNTTIDRSEISDSPYAGETGGLSGKPLFEKSTQVLKILNEQLTASNIPIIASGGIMNEADARGKISAGASLVQLYTGLIYSGPKLISECVDAFNFD